MNSDEVEGTVECLYPDEVEGTGEGMDPRSSRG